VIPEVYLGFIETLSALNECAFVSSRRYFPIGFLSTRLWIRKNQMPANSSPVRPRPYGGNHFPRQVEYSQQYLKLIWTSLCKNL